MIERSCVRKMQDRELYRQVLGIDTPWFVDRVELKPTEGEVHVHLDHYEMVSWACPESGAECELCDHQAGRRWRHLDACQYQTTLHPSPPRLACDEHGVRVINLRGRTVEPIYGSV
jgi:transposase